METQDNKFEEKKSAFSEAEEKLKRLSDIQGRANYFQAVNDPRGWFSEACSLYKEFIGKLTDEERKEGMRQISEIGRRLNSATNISNLENSGVQVIGKIAAPPTSMLFAFDCWCRLMLEKYYGTPNKQDTKGVVTP